MILADGRHEPKVRQGVTTELVGVDGNGFAPFERREDLEAFVELDSGLDGRPEIDYDWTSVASYLARYDGTVSLNVATLVGNSQLRIAALGWDDVPADAAALDRMRGVLRDAMADGAFGLSARASTTRPASYATTEELAALTDEAGRHGGFYHTHVRYPLGDRYLDPFREAIEIGRRADAPAHITHFYHRETHPGPPEPMLALVDDARAEGLDVTFDTYPSEWAWTRLLIQLPQWIQAGGPGPLKERLADRAARDRVRAEFTARGASYASEAGWADVRLGAFRRPENLRWESRTVADVMTETGHDALDVICDLLLAEDLGISQVTSGPAAATLPLFVAHPVGMVGTDSTFLGEKPSPRTYGSFPRILGQFVRDEALLSPRGSDPQDDLGAGGSARAARPWGHPGRGRGRSRRVRSGDGPLDRHVRRAVLLPGRHRAGHRGRHARRRRRRPHRRHARARTARRVATKRRDRPAQAGDGAPPMSWTGGTPPRSMSFASLIAPALLREHPLLGAGDRDRETGIRAGARPADREVERDRARFEPQVAGLADALDVVDRHDLVRLGEEDPEPRRARSAPGGRHRARSG